MTLYKKDVIKHSGAIQISNKISVLQRRTWNVLLANAFDDLDKKEEYKVSIHELAKVLNFDSKNIEYLKEVFRSLNSIQVEWNVLGKDKKEEWGCYNLISGAEIKNGYCYYGYYIALRKRLHNPRMYARISLSLQNQFKSKYTLALFELFLDYFDTKKRYGETSWIPLDKFRALVGVESEEYKEFKKFNQRVIKQPIKEINTITDLYIDLKDGILTKKERRKVVALKFIIHKNDKNVIDLEALEKEQSSEQACLPVPEFEIDNQALLNTLTIEFNIPSNLAVQLLKSKDEYQINHILDDIRKKVELSDNILIASDLALKAFFPQEKKKPKSPPIDEIERRLKEIKFTPFKKIRKLHSDEVLLNAFKELDFEIEKRKKTGVEIDNVAGWFSSRLPESGEPYQFSESYQKHLKAQKRAKNNIAKENRSLAMQKKKNLLDHIQSEAQKERKKDLDKAKKELSTEELERHRSVFVAQIRDGEFSKHVKSLYEEYKFEHASLRGEFDIFLKTKLQIPEEIEYFRSHAQSMNVDYDKLFEELK